MDYRGLMSGRRRGLGPAIVRGGLKLASWAYGLGVRIRNRRYDRRGRLSERAGVPVISIGNLTTGGTGKTPLVCYLAGYLRSQGYRVSLISRGYGRGEAALNDEALELELRLPDVPHVQDPDRVEAARVAVEELATEVIVMDDGFQHRRLHRDLDILVIDATCPDGYGHLLPRGLLREPLSGIRRAQVAVLSRIEQVGLREREAIREAYLRRNADLAWVEASHRPTDLVDHRQRRRPVETLAGTRVLAFCGIGNPEAFGHTIRAAGAELVAFRELPDHTRYDAATVAELERWIAAVRADGPIDRVVCTLKDLVKLRTGRLGGLPLEAIEIALAIDEPGPLLAAVDGVLADFRPESTGAVDPRCDPHPAG